MSCYNCCTRVNLTSQLLLTKGKHADSHWNKPEHRFALQFTTWEGWEWGLFQDVGPLSPSLPREFRFVAVVPNTRELTKWRWRCHLPLYRVFPTRKGRAKRDCCWPEEPSACSDHCWGMWAQGFCSMARATAGGNADDRVNSISSLCFNTDFLSNLRAEQK